MPVLQSFLKVILWLAFATLPAVSNAAEITDVTGRKVEIELPANRVLLGEARQIHVAAALKGEHVFDTIVGWRDDLIKKDPDSYTAYRESRSSNLPNGSIPSFSPTWTRTAPSVNFMRNSSRSPIARAISSLCRMGVNDGCSR